MKHRAPVTHHKRNLAILAAASLVAGLAIAVVEAPSASAGVVTAVTTADAFVASDAPDKVENTTWVAMDAQPLRYGFFKFHVSLPAGASVASAVFRCWAGSSNPAGAGVWTTSSDWSATSLTWNTAPMPDFSLPPSGSTGPVTRGTWADADVTSAVTGSGDLTLVTRTASTTRWSCSAQENGNQHAAQLVITTQAGSGSPSTPPSSSAAPSSSTPDSSAPPSTSTASSTRPVTSTPPATSTAATSSPPATSSSAVPSTSTSSSPAPVPSGHKVMVIVDENHSQTEALNSMPYLASLATGYGQATAYHAVTHPSLPNYLAVAGGNTFGVTDDNPPSSHPIAGDSVFDQSIAAGHTAKTYAEAMTSNCQQSSSGTYAVKHNPWAYFNGSTQRANCLANDVPMGGSTGGNLLNDITAGKLPTTGMMVPDLCNDAHDCALSTADTWLNKWIPLLMAGPDFTSGNLTIIVTFDEDDSSSGNLVAFVAIDPRLKGLHKQVALATDHYSLTRWYDTNVGAAPLRNAASAADLKGAFGL